MKTRDKDIALILYQEGILHRRRIRHRIKRLATIKRK